MDALSPVERSEAMKRWPTLTHMFQALYELIPPNELYKFEPRKIGAPGGYQSARTIAAGLYMRTGENELKVSASEFVIPQEITAQAICYSVINHRVPTYFVADQFIRAVAATELPKDLRIEELKWPREALVFGFPSKFMQEYIGMDVCYVYAAQQHPEPIKCPFLPNGVEIEATREKVSWMWFSWNNGYAENMVGSYWKETIAEAVATDFDYADWTGADATKIAQNKSAVDKVSLLVLKLLCVLNWRDGLVAEERITRPPMIKNGVERPALWSPNIIGSKYRSPSRPGDGTHASPKLHTRSSHWTYQVIGKRDEVVPVLSLPRTSLGYIDWAQVTEEVKEAFWRTHKRIWIPPVLVGVET